MTQYLIKTTTHDTGEVFHDVVKARENEVFTLVDAESEEEALNNVDDDKSRFFDIADIIFIIMLAGWVIGAVLNYLL